MDTYYYEPTGESKLYKGCLSEAIQYVYGYYEAFHKNPNIWFEERIISFFINHLIYKSINYIDKSRLKKILEMKEKALAPGLRIKISDVKWMLDLYNNIKENQNLNKNVISAIRSLIK
jgi:hypothetical protein